MADFIISNKSDGGFPQSGDKFLLERSGQYYSMSADKIAMGMWRIVKGLTQAQIQALNTTPITLFSAPGVGKVASIVHATAFIDHNGTTYATATTLRIKHSGQSNTLFASSTSFIGSASDRYEQLVNTSISATTQQLFANTALVIDANANATNNGGTITVDAIVRVVEFA